MFAAVDPVVVDSVYVPLARLDVVPPVVARAAGTRPGSSQPRAIPARRRRAHPTGTRGRRASRLPREELDRARERVALVVHRGLGLERARDLERARHPHAWTTWRGGRRTTLAAALAAAPARATRATASSSGARAVWTDGRGEL